MITGEVKRYNDSRKFGFIRNGSGPDIYVHAAELRNCKFLKSGVRVRFEVEATDKGLEAKNVNLIRRSRNNSIQDQHFAHCS
ncbi:cold-shock protein [Microbulbifer epialgicus]|uniref:Cold-shock protein n=1 Tax=Microbulbifer epialgicus TaxID=393907 RepID=A0ABV4NTK8_9GAMM